MLAISLAVTGGLVVTGCTSSQTATPSPVGNILLIPGATVQVQTGEYSYILHLCAGANLLDLRAGNQVLSTAALAVNTTSPPSVTAWLQAGTYSGKALHSPWPLCRGFCLPADVGAKEVTPCGWSMTLRLVHAGTR